MIGHKYSAKRTECAVGHLHPSKAEAKRCDELNDLQREGAISALDTEPAFPIIINGKKVCTYKADFEYIDQHGERVIEDVKGMKTPVYRLKKKLVEASYPVKIVEVRR
jgi:hypothetical protein